MSQYRENFSLGKIILPNNILYAPMVGYTDLPFRKIASQFCPGLLFCEMVMVEPVVRRCKEALRMLEFLPYMHPIGAQICGSNPKVAAEAAKMIEDRGFDLIDFNCGCPVDKVTQDGSGSALLKNLPLLERIISSLVASVQIPITLKIRSGWDENHICVEEVVRMAEELGVSLITIHGRTRKQKYEGFSNASYIERGKKIAKEIAVIGNGDVKELASAKTLFALTNCDGLMIARGALYSPWIVKEIRNDSLKIPFIAPDPLEILSLHFSYLEEYYSLEKAIFHMKRIACGYLKGMKGVKKLRMICNKASSPRKIKEAIAFFQKNRDE